MRKIGRRLVALSLLICSFLLGGLLVDKHTLREGLIRLHVVAASDSEVDQDVKIRVKDAVIRSLTQALSNATDIDQAKAYIQDYLPKIEAVAKSAIQEIELQDTTQVVFQDRFQIRFYFLDLLGRLENFFFG